MELIKQHIDIKELDCIVLSELINMITIGEAYYINGEKIIDVTIYYRLVGVVG